MDENNIKDPSPSKLQQLTQINIINDDEFISLINSLSCSIKDFYSDTKKNFVDLKALMNSFYSQAAISRSSLEEILISKSFDKIKSFNEHFNALASNKIHSEIKLSTFEQNMTNFFEEVKLLFKKMKVIQQKKVDDATANGSTSSNNPNTNTSVNVNVKENKSPNLLFSNRLNQNMNGNNHIKIIEANIPLCLSPTLQKNFQSQRNNFISPQPQTQLQVQQQQQQQQINDNNNIGNFPLEKFAGNVLAFINLMQILQESILKKTTDIQDKKKQFETLKQDLKTMAENALGMNLTIQKEASKIGNSNNNCSLMKKFTEELNRVRTSSEQYETIINQLKKENKQLKNDIEKCSQESYFLKIDDQKQFQQEREKMMIKTQNSQYETIQALQKDLMMKNSELTKYTSATNEAEELRMEVSKLNKTINEQIMTIRNKDNTIMTLSDSNKIQQKKILSLQDIYSMVGKSDIQKKDYWINSTIISFSIENDDKRDVYMKELEEKTRKYDDEIAQLIKEKEEWEDNVKQLKKDNETVTCNLNDKTTQMKELQITIDKLMTNEKEATMKNKALNSEVNELNESNRKLLSSIDLLKNDLSLALAKTNNKSDDIKQKDIEIKDLKQSNQRLSKTIDQMTIESKNTLDLLSKTNELIKQDKDHYIKTEKELKDNIVNLTHQLDQNHLIISQYETKTKDLENSIKMTRQTLAQTEEELNKEVKKSSQSIIEVNEMKETLTRMTINYQNGNDQNNQLSAEIKSLNMTISSLNRDKEDLVNEVVKHQNELSQLKDKDIAQHKDLDKQLTETTLELKNIKKSVNDNESLIASQQNEIDRLNEIIEKTTNHSDHNDKILSELNEKLHLKEEELKQHNSTLSRLNMSIKKYEEQFKKQEESINSYQNDIETKDDNIIRLTNENTAIITEFNRTREEKDNLLKEIKSLKYIIKTNEDTINTCNNEKEKLIHHLETNNNELGKLRIEKEKNTLQHSVLQKQIKDEEEKKLIDLTKKLEQKTKEYQNLSVSLQEADIKIKDHLNTIVSLKLTLTSYQENEKNITQTHKANLLSKEEAINTLRDHIKKLTSTINNQSNQIKDYQSDILKHTSLITKLQSDLSSKSSLIACNEDTINTLTNKLTQLSNTQSSATNDLKEKESIILALKELNQSNEDKHNKQITKMLNEIKEQKAEIFSLSKTIEQLEQTKQDLFESNEFLQNSIAKLDKKFNDSQQSNIVKDNDYKTIKNTINDLNKEKSIKDKEITDLQNNINELKNTIECNENDLFQLKAELSDKGNILINKEKELKRLKKSTEDYKSETTNEINQLKKSNDLLTKQNNTIEKEMSKSRSLLDQYNNRFLSKETEVNLLKATIDELSNKAKTKDTEANRMKDELNKIKEQLSRMKFMHSQTEEDKERILNQEIMTRSKLTKELDQLTEDHTELKERYAKESSTNSRLNNELKKSNDIIAQVSSQVIKLQEENVSQRNILESQGNDLKKNAEALSHMTKQLGKLQDENMNLESHIETLEHDLSAITCDSKDKTSKTNEVIKQLSKEKKDIEGRYDALSQDYEIQKTTLKDLNEEFANAKETNAKLQGQLNDNKDEVIKTKNELKEMKDLIITKQSDLKNAMNDLLKNKDAYQKLQNEKIKEAEFLTTEYKSKDTIIFKLRGKCTDKDEQIASLINDTINKDNQIANLLKVNESQLDQLNNAISLSKDKDNEIGELLKLKNDQDKEITDLIKENKEKTDQMQSYQKQINDKQQTIDQQLKTINNLTASNEEINYNNAYLEEAMKDLEGKFDSLSKLNNDITDELKSKDNDIKTMNELVLKQEDLIEKNEECFSKEIESLTIELEKIREELQFSNSKLKAAETAKEILTKDFNRATLTIESNIKEHNQYIEDIKKLSSLIEILQGEKRESDTDKYELQKHNETLTTRLAQAEEMIREVKESKMKIQSDYNNINDMISFSKKTIEELQLDNTILKQSLNIEKEKVAEMEMKLKEKEDHIKDSKMTIGKMKTFEIQMGNMTNIINISQDKIKELTIKLKSEEDRNQVLMKQINEEKESNCTMLNQLEEESHSLQSKAEALSKGKDDLDKKLHFLEDSNKQLKQINNDHTMTINSLTAKIKKQNEELMDQDSKISKLKEDITDLNEQLSFTTSQLDSQIAKTELYMKQKKDLNTTISELKAEIMVIKDKQIKIANASHAKDITIEDLSKEKGKLMLNIKDQENKYLKLEEELSSIIYQQASKDTEVKEKNKDQLDIIDHYTQEKKALNAHINILKENNEKATEELKQLKSHLKALEQEKNHELLLLQEEYKKIKKDNDTMQSQINKLTKQVEANKKHPIVLQLKEKDSHHRRKSTTDQDNQPISISPSTHTILVNKNYLSFTWYLLTLKKPNTSLLTYSDFTWVTSEAIQATSYNKFRKEEEEQIEMTNKIKTHCQAIEEKDDVIHKLTYENQKLKDTIQSTTNLTLSMNKDTRLSKENTMMINLTCPNMPTSPNNNNRMSMNQYNEVLKQLNDSNRRISQLQNENLKMQRELKEKSVLETNCNCSMIKEKNTSGFLDEDIRIAVSEISYDKEKDKHYEKEQKGYSTNSKHNEHEHDHDHEEIEGQLSNQLAYFKQLYKASTMQHEEISENVVKLLKNVPVNSKTKGIIEALTKALQLNDKP